MIAVRRIGCMYILARCMFICLHANNFGLIYVNRETHGGWRPCLGPGPETGGSGSRASREWRERRDQAGEPLLHRRGDPKGPLRRQAWRVFHRWREGEITFKEEAEEKLREIAGEAKAREPEA